VAFPLACSSRHACRAREVDARHDILYAHSPGTLRAKVMPRTRPLEGLDHIDKVIDIDQSPIGRTPVNPATYTGLFTPIRELFTYLPESKIRLRPGDFPST